MKKLLFLAALCLPLLFGSCAKKVIETSVTIYGSVYDRETQAPIQGATITITPGKRHGYTGSDGTYYVTDLEPGIYKVQAQADGYKSDWVPDIDLKSAGSQTEVSFGLNKL